MSDGHNVEYDAGRPEAEVLKAIIDYCRLSEGFANEGVIPEAVGMARAYKDVADRLDARLAALRPLPPGQNATESGSDVTRDAIIDRVYEHLDPDGYGWASGDGPTPEQVIEALISLGFIDVTPPAGGESDD